MKNSSRVALLGTLVLSMSFACADGSLPNDAGVEETDGGRQEPEAFGAEDEVEVQVLELAASASSPNFEYSGLAWFGDTLILLSEFSDGAWAISKDAIADRIDGTDDTPLSPSPVTIVPALSGNNIPNFDGLEAIAFSGTTAFLSIETSGPQGGGGALLRGTIADDASTITFDLDTMTLNPTPVPQESNSSYEAIVVTDDGLLTLYELNGSLVNPEPIAPLFDRDFGNRMPLPISPLEYRVTDATALDDQGRFWAMNFRFPGDGRAAPEQDPLVEEYGEGETHALYEQVERIVEFEIVDDEVVRVDRPPLTLHLPGEWTEDESRNREGIVRFDDRGFLVITDRFPVTIFAFVPFP